MPKAACASKVRLSVVERAPDGQDQAARGIGSSVPTLCWREMDFEPSVPRKEKTLVGRPVRSPAIRLPQKKPAPSRGTESSNPFPSSRQSVSRPDPAVAGRKTRGSARVCARCGRQRQRSTGRNCANRRCYLCRAIFQYRSAADVIGQRRPRPSQSSRSGQFLKQSRAGRVAPARPAADVSGRAACLP